MTLFILGYVMISLCYLFLQRAVATKSDPFYKDVLWCPFWPIPVFALACILTYDAYLKARE